MNNSYQQRDEPTISRLLDGRSNRLRYRVDIIWDIYKLMI